MSSIPGSFESQSSSDDDGILGLSEGENPMDTMDEDEDDSDFAPGEGDELLMETDNDDEEETPTDTEGAAPRSLQIAYDSATRQILIVDGQGNATRLTASHLRGSTMTLRSIRTMLEQRFGRSAGGGDDDDDEEDEDDDGDDSDDDGGIGAYWGGGRRKKKVYYDIIEGPQDAGVNLERGGEFGMPPRKYAAAQRKFVDYSTNLAQVFRTREYDYRKTPKSSIGSFTVPNSSGTEVSQFQSKVYSGQYSADGSFFYTACQDFNIYIYDTRNPPLTGKNSVSDPTAPQRGRRGLGTYWEHRSSLRTLKIIKGQERNCRWTITDANLSPDNDWIIYSSITPRVHLAKTGEGANWETSDHDQQTLDFAAGVRGSPSFGIWSVRFSNDGKEVVAGANDGQIFVFDIETNRTILRVNAHRDDVNAVAFADSSSSNLLLSGSDDSFVKVWDRRSMSGERASGTLVGHTQGVTYVAPKGDGRYCLSNGKDQGMKLWDLRMMMNGESFDKFKLDQVDYGIPGWDYRSFYAKPRYKEHPHDVSVMTYRGHSVLRTLIRCHFSPIATTDQRYVYSGSTDGVIHIWSLDGQIVQTLDRRNTHPLINAETGQYNDPSDVDLRNTNAQVRGSSGSTVRDVSWNPFQPKLISTAWEGRGGIEGSLSLHEWKGQKGETIEDQASRSVAESTG